MESVIKQIQDVATGKGFQNVAESPQERSQVPTHPATENPPAWGVKVPGESGREWGGRRSLSSSFSYLEGQRLPVGTLGWPQAGAHARQGPSSCSQPPTPQPLTQQRGQGGLG